MLKEPIINSFLRISLLLFIIAILVLEFPGARDFVSIPYSGIETRSLIVQNLRDTSPNAGKDIRFGDQVYAIEGVRVRNFNHYRYLIHLNQDFSSRRYTLLRDGEPVEVAIEYTAVPSWKVSKKFAFLLVALTFLLVGAIVYIRRSDILGGLFSLNCTIIAFFLTDRPVVASPALQLFGELFHDFAILMFPALFLNFFLVFPDRFHSGGRIGLRWLPLLYTPPILIFLIDCYFVVSHFLLVPGSEQAAKAIIAVSTLYLAGYLVASLVIFIRNYLSSPSAQKQRLRIVIAGTVAGIVPFLATLVWRQISPGDATVWEAASAVCLAFISISFGYAILKHGAIELNIVVRKSLVYALLTGAVIAAYYMLVNVLGDFFAHEFNLGGSAFSVFAIFALFILFAPARDRVQRFVDRIFYRGDYVYKEEIFEFNRQLSSKLGRQDILECFFERVEKLLKSSYIAIYTKTAPRTFSLEKSTGNPPELPTSFPVESFLGRYFSRYRKPLMVEYLDRSWERRNVDKESKDFLATTQAAVCLPIASQKASLGLVLLGAKRSGLPYSRADAELLETFAEHFGVVLENASLQEAAIEQERLKSEVLLARDIQLSLLPKAPPKHRSVDIVGKMLSSREVGGDYFDYFHLDEDRIALAIGDVSGKGIPAAMLMFSIQAVFKNMALKEKLSPGELTSELNRYLCENAESGQFATFFYGSLDLRDSIFRYSNAGQCPALLVREAYADRLGEGGMMLGVEKHADYQEGSVRIEPGDLLCLYTDGIIEQKSSEDEDFGEKRLIEFLQVNRFSPAARLQEALFKEVVSFGSGRQNDDITTVIAQYKGQLALTRDSQPPKSPNTHFRE